MVELYDDSEQFESYTIKRPDGVVIVSGRAPVPYERTKHHWGRFLSPDWEGIPAPVPYGLLDNPQTLNHYSYVKTTPLPTPILTVITSTSAMRMVRTAKRFGMTNSTLRPKVKIA